MTNTEMRQLYERVCALRAKISADLNYSMSDLKDMNYLTEMLRLKLHEVKETEPCGKSSLNTSCCP